MSIHESYHLLGNARCTHDDCAASRTVNMAVRGIVGNFGTFVLAAGAALVPMTRSFDPSFNPLRVLVVLALLTMIHVLRYPKVLFCREFAVYAVFTGYMFLSLLWTPDIVKALNTLFPSVNFLLILILFGSLVRYHDLRAVLAGILFGFLVGAATYTYLEGFPLVRPQDFSYNAVAAVYLFGLFITLVFSWFTGSRVLPLSLGFVILAHIVATTSIKTSLGILVGVVAACFVYFGRTMRIVLRNVVLFAVVGGLFVYVFASNEGVVERVQAGIDRISLGVEILQAGEARSRSTSFGLREDWAALGLEGWATNPIFGEGIEAFRADYGNDPHSTPIDLLYNTGLIGLLLFYAIFASVAWRLFDTRHVRAGSLHPLILAGLVCYAFMTMSGTAPYNYYLAIFIAISTALLRQLARQGSSSKG